MTTGWCSVIRDGRTIEMTPEVATGIQMRLGADVAMAFDQCPPYPATENDVVDACRRTHAWLERCVNAHQRQDQALFGIVQGGCFPHLRRESARAVADFDLPGIAVGGVSGELVEEMHRIIRDVTPLLPTDRPRYLMGIERCGRWPAGRTASIYSTAFYRLASVVTAPPCGG